MAHSYQAVTNKFQPQPGQRYYFIGVPGSIAGNVSTIIGNRVWSGSKAAKARMARNNVFETFREAQVVRIAIEKAFKAAQVAAPTARATYR